MAVFLPHYYALSAVIILYTRSCSIIASACLTKNTLPSTFAVILSIISAVYGHRISAITSLFNYRFYRKSEPSSCSSISEGASAAVVASSSHLSFSG